LRSESGNILLFFKIMFPEQENNIFDCNVWHFLSP